MIWLVLAACAMCLLVGLGLGIGLSSAARRGDDRTGMIDLTGFELDIPKIDPTLRVSGHVGSPATGPIAGRSLVSADAEDRTVRGRTVSPGDQSAA